MSLTGREPLLTPPPFDECFVDEAAATLGLGELAYVIEPIAATWSVSARAQAAIYPASMIKLPIAVAAASLLGDAELTVEQRHLTSNDAPSPFVIGYRANAWAYIDAMISYSDNVATNVLIDAAGRGRATTLCASYGLQGTAVRRYLSGSAPRIVDNQATGENLHSARDCARLLLGIVQGTLPGAARIRSALDAQYWNAKLSAGLRIGDHFAHKTGDTSDVSHDGGILTTSSGAAYIVVAYSTRASSNQTDKAFADLMRALRARL